MAIIEGDIAIGTAEQVREHTRRARDEVAINPNIAEGVGITGSQFRWPNCRIAYEIDALARIWAADLCSVRQRHRLPR
jgi:hypothetical protein